MRDDFPQETKDVLAKRVGFRCSNPSCRLTTSGPRKDIAKAINIGVAAHITAAASGGPRYDRSLTSEQRSESSNGIWLCQKCAKLVDNDANRYTAILLRQWKADAEHAVLREIEGSKGMSSSVVGSNADIFAKLQKLMPELLAEMRNDLNGNPLQREFILMNKRAVYWEGPERPVFRYHFEEHPELRSKMRVLENVGLITDIKFNNVDRYVMSEALADYLLGV